MNRSLIAALVVAASGLAACAHHTSEGATDTTSMKLETTCDQTVCDSMQAWYESEVDQCFDAAAEAFADPSMCETSGPTCDDSDRKTCSSTNWKFDVRAPADPAYQAACERSLDHASSCGVTGVGNRQNCEVYAKVERPELAHFYDCLTQTPCDQVATTTACDPAPGTLGDELCDELAQQAQTAGCPSDLRALLNEEAGWLREDVINAGRACLKAFNAQDMAACIQAWLDTVQPPAVSE